MISKLTRAACVGFRYVSTQKGSGSPGARAVPHCASMTDVPMHRTQRWTPDDTRFPPLTPQHHRAKLLGLNIDVSSHHHRFRDLPSIGSRSRSHRARRLAPHHRAHALQDPARAQVCFAPPRPASLQRHLPRAYPAPGPLVLALAGCCRRPTRAPGRLRMCPRCPYRRPRRLHEWHYRGCRRLCRRHRRRWLCRGWCCVLTSSRSG